MTPLDSITLLNNLIVTAKNAEGSFRAASEEAHDAELKQSLRETSRYLHEAAHELAGVVQRLGGTPHELNTFGNALHRTWMHLKSTALGRDEREILADWAQDEAEVEGDFERAVREEAPADIHAVVERHYRGLLERRDRVRAWGARHLGLAA